MSFLSRLNEYSLSSYVKHAPVFFLGSVLCALLSRITCSLFLFIYAPNLKLNKLQCVV